MNRLTFRPKQSLGQNFLVDENIARKIIRLLTPKSEDVIIEIGPGFGVLTKYIIRAAQKVIAVEIDRDLAEQLRVEFGHVENLELIEADFLRFDLTEYFNPNYRLRILGNIPYHITSPVIFKSFEIRKQIYDLTLMIQREVAERVVASPGNKDYGILSVFSQLYSEPEILFHVSRNVFKPKPDVDSSVLRWDFAKAVEPAVRNEELLRRIIKVTFQQRRKMLRKSLQQIPELAKMPDHCDFNLEKRPEALSPAEFVELTNMLAE